MKNLCLLYFKLLCYNIYLLFVNIVAFKIVESVMVFIVIPDPKNEFNFWCTSNSLLYLPI